MNSTFFMNKSVHIAINTIILWDALVEMFAIQNLGIILVQRDIVHFVKRLFK